MLELANYTPSTWIDEDGLLKRMTSRVMEIARMARRGKWSHKIAKMVVAVSIGAAMNSTIEMPATEAHVVQLDLFAAGGHGRGGVDSVSESDVVPDGYWEKLGRAMDAVGRLPAQDLSRDPPALV